MKRLTLGTLVGLALAAAVAWSLGGATGAGALLGFGLAALLGVGTAAWQLGLARRRPAFVLNAFVIAFLAKLAVLLAGALVLRYAYPAADWTSFLVAFPIGVLWVTAIGTPMSARALRHGAA